MTKEHAEELTQAVGQSVSGVWRTIAALQKLGVPKVLGLSVEQWVHDRLGGYVKYSMEERRQAAVELAAGGQSQREIGAILGVDHETVGRDLRAGANAPREEPEANDIGTGPGANAPLPMDALAALAVTDEMHQAAESAKAKAEAVARREEKKDRLRIQADLPDAKYRVIYADPAWSYNDKADVGSVQTGGAAHQYPTMTIAELCALDVKSIAARDAVLFLWVTSPLLFEAKAVIEAWGFTYRALFIWDKVKHNMGHYNSVRHELLLVCTRGSCTPDVPELFDSVQSIERTTHSTKPGEFRTIIDTLYPHGKRLELFARREEPGWMSWGNELNQAVVA